MSISLKSSLGLPLQLGVTLGNLFNEPQSQFFNSKFKLNEVKRSLYTKKHTAT